MKRAFLLVLVLLLWSCNEKTPEEEDLHYLNGYWEIAEVRLPDGSKKEYSVNPNIDFIQFENGQGFRKKVRPKFDGTYNTSKDVEFFTVAHTEEAVTLFYKSDFDEWEERLVQVDSLSFSVMNNEGTSYVYKRFEPIVIPK